MLRTIRGQIILGGTALVVAIHLIIGAIVYFALDNHLLSNHLTNQTQTAIALCKSLTQWRGNFERQSLDVMSNPRIQQHLRNGLSYTNGSLRQILLEYSGEYHLPQMIYMTDANGLVIGSHDKDVSAYINDRLNTADSAQGGVVWDSGYEPNYIILYRRVNDPIYDISQGIGYLFMFISTQELFDLFSDYRLDATQRFALNGINNSFEAVERGFFYDYYGGYSDLLHSEVSFNGWKLRTWTAKSVALAPTQSLYKLLFITLGGTLLAAVVILFVFSTRMTKQLSVMKRAIIQYSSGDFEIRTPLVQKNEIGRLAGTLNDMAEHIQALILQLRNEERQKRKIQLRTLEYQINPHLLYNTLDSINMLARQNNDPAVADLVTALSRLFRLGLHGGKEIVLVKDEAMHVYYYLQIQSIRFDGQLLWEISIDEDIREQRIIKFILQPLVENAINHGIRKKATPGLVTMTGWQEDGSIFFEVADDGVGIAPKRLTEIRSSLSVDIFDDSAGESFGLRNVNQRIHLQYGSNYCLTIDSEEDRGTIVTICLPCMS